MDPNQTPPFPPQTGDIPSVVNPTPTPPIDTGGTPPVTATPTGRGRTPKGLIATIFGLLLLVGGVGAGLLLVRQNQDIREKAAGSGTSGICSTGDCSSCSNVCDVDKESNNFNGTETCIVKHYFCPCGTTGGAAGCTDILLGGDGNYAKSCGSEQVDVVCVSKETGLITKSGYKWDNRPNACTGTELPEGWTCGGGTTTAPTATIPPGWQPCGSCPSTGGGDCFQKPDGSFNHPLNECQINDQGTCVWNPSLCGGGGGGGPAPTPKPACGSACTQTSDCAPAANGGTVICSGGICQNASCIGKTVPGANCDCSALNNCGQPCGASVGLCQAGSACTYINGPNCGITSSSNPTTYCVPVPAPSGWTTANCVARDQGNSYILNAGANPTVAQIQAACAPATASCAGLTAYDTNWNLLSPAQLAALKAGDKVRFTVAGTTTSGVFDKARFTINGTQRPEVTGKRPNSADFYDEYTVPAGTTSFTVSAQVHHSALNQWY